MSSILISKIVFLHAACIPQICEFNIDSSNFLIYTVIQKGLCAISGIPMTLELNSEYILSLDKIEPSLGYVENNVQWVCWCVNRAKGQMPLPEFILLCRTIVEKCND